ncbi:MAG: hypothetical protein K6C99_07820 [Lachnospiraceae bacterium]|nr:hypothetical protein [Lachnospiraceae bacterium]
MSDQSNKTTAYFHLPGLFEFYEFYKVFLPVYKEHPEFFHDQCRIGSVYGAPADCIWGGGRVGYGDNDPIQVLDLMDKYHISARLTFSNSLLREEHLKDEKCNRLCRLFEKSASDHYVSPVRNGIIVHSDMLTRYILQNYPSLYLVSSTTKVLTNFEDLQSELSRSEFSYVVPDFRLNRSFDRLASLSEDKKRKVEFLCNECCYVGCTDRKACYENVSRKALGEDCPDHICNAPEHEGGYMFSKAMKSPAFISSDDIRDIYIPMGFNNFKIEGRSLGSALLLEFILYYMTKPEYQINVREMIYLDNTLDLF